MTGGSVPASPPEAVNLVTAIPECRYDSVETRVNISCK